MYTYNGARARVFECKCVSSLQCGNELKCDATKKKKSILFSLYIYIRVCERIIFEISQ